MLCSCWVVQAELEPVSLLPLPAKCWYQVCTIHLYTCLGLGSFQKAQTIIYTLSPSGFGLGMEVGEWIVELEDRVWLN